MNDKSLYHYGIPGMKWGISRSQSQLGQTGRLRSDSKKNHEIKSMSDQELRNRINRLQMEKQYTQLTQKEKSAGRRFIENVLKNAAQQTASKYLSKYMDKGVRSVLKQTRKR